jgi:hypothetical protein
VLTAPRYLPWWMYWPPVNPRVAGSIPAAGATAPWCEWLAWLFVEQQDGDRNPVEPPSSCRCSLSGIEHETFNFGDTGSSPVTCTTPVWWNVYTLASEASAARHGGSTPSTGTNVMETLLVKPAL